MRATLGKRKSLFYIPAFQFLTLDDEVMGTRSQSNPVKSISVRKSDREGKSADVVSDELFRFAIESRLHRRGEILTESINKQLKNVQYGINHVMYWYKTAQH